MITFSNRLPQSYGRVNGIRPWDQYPSIRLIRPCRKNTILHGNYLCDWACRRVKRSDLNGIVGLGPDGVPVLSEAGRSLAGNAWRRAWAGRYPAQLMAKGADGLCVGR